MPLIMPIKDLRNTTEISNIAHKEQEPIFITKNGKTIAKLTSPYQNKLDTVDALLGSIPDTITFEEARKEQLSKV